MIQTNALKVYNTTSLQCKYFFEMPWKQTYSLCASLCAASVNILYGKRKKDFCRGISIIKKLVYLTLLFSAILYNSV